MDNMLLYTVQLPLTVHSNGPPLTAYGFRPVDMRQAVRNTVGSEFTAARPSRGLSQLLMPPLLRDVWVTDHEGAAEGGLDMIVTVIGGAKVCVGLRLHPDSPRPAIAAFPLPANGTCYDRPKSKTSDGVCNPLTRCWVATDRIQNYCFVTKGEVSQMTNSGHVDAEAAKWRKALLVGWTMINVWNDHRKPGFTLLDRFDNHRLRLAVNSDGLMAAECVYNSFYDGPVDLLERDHFDRLVISEANWLSLLGNYASEDLLFIQAKELPNGIDWRQRIVMTTSKDRILVHQQHDKTDAVIHKLTREGKDLPGKLTGDLESQILDAAIVAELLHNSDASHAIDAIRRLTGFGIHRKAYAVDKKPRGGNRTGHKRRASTQPLCQHTQTHRRKVSPEPLPVLPVLQPLPMNIPMDISMDIPMGIPMGIPMDAIGGGDTNIDEFNGFVHTFMETVEGLDFMHSLEDELLA